MAQARSPFQGVVTTGIYCRQGCSGTPKRANVRPFGFAAAAEANGFRPCLRCRPDTMPEPAAWLAPSELVCRSLRLISEGWLDTRKEEDLAAALGVSERHLRRLFDAHVGATPDAVARSRRVHFARRLLVETDLTVADVGFAAGFGSVRQMNRVVREVFAFTPTELRRRRLKGDRPPTPARLELRIPYRPPLDWDSLASFLSHRAVPGVERVDGDAYARTVCFDGTPGMIEIVWVRGKAHALLRAHLPSVAGLIHVVDQARRMFDLDADPGPIDRHLGSDPLLEPLVRARPGLRVPGAWDPFETGVRAILGQHVSVPAARTLTARLVDLFGGSTDGSTGGSARSSHGCSRDPGELERGGLRRLFPSPERLAGSDLGSVGLTSARARTLSRFAAEVAAGSLNLDASMGLDALVARLREVPGVGDWTAHYIALRACGERDAFPSGDLGLRRALGGGRPVSAGQLERRAQTWRPWRAYGAMHLWAAGYVGGLRGTRKTPPPPGAVAAGEGSPTPSPSGA